MSAQPYAQRRGFLAALVAQVSSYVLEPLPDEQVAPARVELEPHPVVAIVPAARRAGSTTIARLLAAELALRADGAAVVCGSGGAPRRTAPPSRAAARLATALGSVGSAARDPGAGPRACGRLCVVSRAEPADVAAAARYLAPVVVDLSPDGSAAEPARIADRAVVLASTANEPALAAAVADQVGGEPLIVVNRVAELGGWEGRAHVVAPDARVAARAALVGARATGPLGAAISAVADALEAGA